MGVKGSLALLSWSALFLYFVPGLNASLMLYVVCAGVVARVWYVAPAVVRHSHDDANHLHAAANHSHDDANHSHDAANHSHDDANYSHDAANHSHNDANHSQIEDNHSHEINSVDSNSEKNRECNSPTHIHFNKKIKNNMPNNVVSNSLSLNLHSFDRMSLPSEIAEVKEHLHLKSASTQQVPSLHHTTDKIVIGSCDTPSAVSSTAGAVSQPVLVVSWAVQLSGLVPVPCSLAQASPSLAPNTLLFQVRTLKVFDVYLMKLFIQKVHHTYRHTEEK